MAILDEKNKHFINAQTGNFVQKSDRRLRISALDLRDANGRTISFGNGLAGYALGQSTKSWTAPGSARGFATNGSASISAQSDNGPIQAVASVIDLGQ